MGGDISCISVILEANPLETQKAAARLPKLLLSRSALIRLLNKWRTGQCTAADVQQWASFVRRGYVPGAGINRLGPIDIEYNENDEELIV